MSLIRDVKIGDANKRISGHILEKIDNVDNDYFISANKRIYNRMHRGYFEYDTGAKNPNSPLNPWAFIRVCNEIVTLRACLESILPAIQRGVIGYNNCTDGSEEVILEFCGQYPSFIPVKYPYDICLQGLKEEKNKLYMYYNYVLSFIPQNEWLIKIDADHIYDAKKLYKMLYFPTNPDELVFIPRLNLDVIDDEVYIIPYSKEKYWIEGSDHWLINNRNLIFDQGGYYDGGWVYSHSHGRNYVNEVCGRIFEGLHVKNHFQAKQIYSAELNNYHFYNINKEKRNLKKGDNWITIDQYLETNPENLVDIKIDKSFFNKERILKQYKKFNFSKNYRNVAHRDTLVLKSFDSMFEWVVNINMAWQDVCEKLYSTKNQLDSTKQQLDSKVKELDSKVKQMDSQIKILESNQNQSSLKIQRLAEANQQLDLKNQRLTQTNSQLNLKTKELDFTLRYGTAKDRIHNHLSYKLGQAMIENSKSLLGYIRMPYVLSYIKDKHKQEQQQYQEAIKKNPNLKLPNLESYPDYKESLKEKECLTYKLGEAFIKASKTWYKGGYVKLWFEVKKLKGEGGIIIDG